MKKGIIVSGYFNPVHKGHLEYFKLAKKHGTSLIVIVNNDFQRKLKGSDEFMLESERVLIISEFQLVDKVYLSIDQDRTVIETLKKIHREMSNNYELFFANGGDQNNDSIPEKKTCEILKIKLIDNLGDKIQSSSWILDKKK
jgi:cytidyltransferase-like protein